MYYEYDLMFHYLLAALRRADDASSVTAAGVKTFNTFAGLGEHRWLIIPRRLWWSCFWPFATDMLCVHHPLFTAGGIFLCYTSVLANHSAKCCRISPRRPMTKSTPLWARTSACKFIFYLAYLYHLALFLICESFCAIIWIFHMMSFCAIIRNFHVMYSSHETSWFWLSFSFGWDTSWFS